MSDAKTITDKEVPKLPWEVFPESGDSFAGYTLGKAIGKGSFGTVFQVQSDPDVEWFEAVKILHRSGDIDKKRFLDEISRLKEIRIPGMARIHAAGECDGHLYYCMDYIEGVTIDEFIENGHQSRLMPLFIELCDVVQRLHELNFIHLDIKPHNVMVNEEGQIRLLDLGISCKTGESSDISSEGFGAGTYEFAPPEQIDGKVPEPAMDVYALGCLLYTLLTSAHPKIPYDPIKREKPYGIFYPRPGLERPELLSFCLGGEITRPSVHNPLVSDKIDAVILKSLDSSGNRYASVKEFKEALIGAGALNELFVVALDEGFDPEIYSRINRAVSEISLEFNNEFQVVVTGTDKASEDEIDLGVSPVKKDGFLNVNSIEKVQEVFIQKLRKKLFEKVDKSTVHHAWESSPYKSLNSYSEQEAELFFGRDNEILELYKNIKNLPPTEGLMAVLAPSGAGKSSFLQAGIIPHCKSDKSLSWSTIFSLPGSGGFTQIKATVENFLKSAQTDRSLIIIDQFEEFLHEKENLDSIAETLKKWYSQKANTVILSLRNDYYKEYISFLEANKLPDNFYNLPQPDEINLAKMIRMPALMANLTFEKNPVNGKPLDEVLCDEAMLNPESLAALSFTLDEIFNKSPKGKMSFSVYSELGGMHGAMAQRAEALFRSLQLKRANMVFHHVFHQLIQVDENRVPRRLHADYKKLTSDEEAKKLTDEFIKAKLFQVTNEADTNKRIVTVSHEALIQQNQENGWRRVMYWLTRQRNNLIIRKRLAVAVNDWYENDCQPRFLYSSYGRLKEILTLRKSGWSLSDRENKFIKHSYRAMIRNGMLIMASFIALIWISVSLWKESNTVTNLTKNINEKKEEVDKLTKEADHQRNVLDSLRKQEERVKKQLSAMDDYNRLSLISSLQQSGTLPPATAISLLSEVSEERRNWLWGQLLYKSLPDYLMLFGHHEEILSVEFSHDKESQYLLTSSWDDQVILWDGKTGELVKSLEWQPQNGSKMDFEDAAFSYDGYAVAANNDGCIYYWNIDQAVNGNEHAVAVSLPHVKIRKLFFSKDGKYMTCAGSEGKFSIWDWENKNFSKPLAMGIHSNSEEEDLKRVYSAQLSPDSSILISTGWDGSIKKWSWNGEKLSGGEDVGSHESQVWSGTFSNDGKLYLSAGRDRIAKLWDVSTFELVKEFGAIGEGEHKSDVRAAIFSPDGKTVVTAARDKKVRFWDVESGRLVLERQIHDNIIYDLSFSNDGKRFASVSADRLVNLCYMNNFNMDNIKSGRVMYHSDAVEHFDVYGDTLATASSDGTVRIWDLYPSTLRSYFDHPLAKGDFLLKSFLLGRDKVLTADSNGSIYIWQLQGDNWIRKLTLSRPSESTLNDLVMDKEKNFVAASYIDGSIIVWDLAQQKLLFSGDISKGIKSPVICFAPLDQKIICGDNGGKVILFDWKQNKIITEWQPQSRKIFDIKVTKIDGVDCVISSSRDGTVVISSFDGKEVKKVSHGVRGDASYAAISSDGVFMATASARDNNVFIWDLYNEIELLPLSGHEEPISQVEFVNDDLIVSASRDGTVRLWYSLSWDQLQSKIKEGDKKLPPKDLLQKAVRVYLYGNY